MKSAPSQVSMVRVSYLLLGLTCVGLGWIGFFVPGMPSTIFFIVALFAFQRSSPRLENWLLEHRIFGPTLRNWRANGSVSKRTKVVAVSMLWLCVGASSILIGNVWAAAALAITAALVTWYILTRPTAQ